MYWFTKFCCMCLTTECKNGFHRLDTNCKDKIKLFDKMTISLSEEFQDLLRYKIPDAVVCHVCRNNIVRNYNAHVKIVKSLNKIKGYIEKLTNKKEQSAELHDDNKNKKIKLSVSENTVEYQEKIAHDTHSTNTNDFNKTHDNFVEPNIKTDFNDSFKSEIEYPYIKTELFDYKNDITIKEEFNIDDFRTSSPIDIKQILNEFDEDDFNNTTIPLSEPAFHPKYQLNEPDNSEIFNVLLPNNCPQKDVDKNQRPLSYSCPVCKMKFSCPNILIVHLNSEHTSLKYTNFDSQMVL